MVSTNSVLGAELFARQDELILVAVESRERLLLPYRGVEILKDEAVVLHEDIRVFGHSR